MVLIYEKILIGEKEGQRELIKVFYKTKGIIYIELEDEIQKRKEKIIIKNIESVFEEIFEMLNEQDNPNYSNKTFQIAKEIETKIKEWNNKSKKFNKSIVTDVTDVTDDDKNLPVTSVTDSTLLQGYIEVILGNSNLDRIIRFLLQNKKYFTFGEIAKKTFIKAGSVRQAINRKKEYFLIKACNSKKNVTQLSQIALDDLNKEIEKIKEIEEKKKEQEIKLKLTEMKKKEFIVEVNNFFYTYKPKREGNFIIIDFSEVVLFSSKLADMLFENPDRFLKQLYQVFPFDFNVKIINVPPSNNFSIEDIRKEQLNSMFVVEGRVTSLGEVRPVISEIIFECPSCGGLIKVEQNYRIGILEEPKICSCGRRGGFRISERKEVNSCFVQLEDLQDKTDNPHSRRIKGVLFNGLCDNQVIKSFTPGNEVRCVGILKEVPIKKGGSTSLFLNWVFEILNVELIEKEIEIDKFSDEEMNKIKEISQEIDSNGLCYLYDSFAPEVYGYEEIKGAMILQACNKRNEPKIKAVRNKSNILLIGDPGIAKSVLGDFALKVSTGSRKAVGGGSSAVGITASVVKEEDSLGGYRVEPGAMILAKDLLFLDELNNLQEEDKPKLQEGMSDQRVSINKANLHVQMKVTCGIIAAANPIHGSFKPDDKLTIQEQFNITTPILNRFDSIFIIRDRVDEDGDKNIAERMINRQRGNLKSKCDSDFLRKFFAYIRNLEEPKINDKTQLLLSGVYSECRKTYNPGVKINPRFLESLIRMSIASAKIRISKNVELKDIQTALSILSKTQYNIDEVVYLKVKND